jgi:DNA-binding CsgD family transcriptional regulator
MPTSTGAAVRVQERSERPSLTPVPVRRFRTLRLSGQERAVLRELARGFTTEEVADVLVVSPHTVRSHLKNGMKKLGARTRAHAVAIALSEGAIDFADDR